MPKRSQTDSTKSTTWVQNKLGKLKVGQTFDLKFLQGIITLKVEKHSDVLILAIVQFKSGVGKSTTAFELAEMFRTQYGWNVLLVDSDAQRHSSCMLLRDDTLEERKEMDESESDDSSDEETKQQESVKLERTDSTDTTQYHGIASVLHDMTDTIQHGTIPAMPGPVNYTGASRYQYAFSSFTQQEERSLFEVLRGGYWPNPTVRVNDINTYPQPIELDLDNYGNDKCGKMWIIPGDVRMKLIDEALTTADTHSKILRWDC